MMRVNALCCALLVLIVAVHAEGENPISDVIKADTAIKDAIFKRTTTPESTVPSPYVPADVIVTVPVTEILPTQAPPVTVGPPPTTVPGPSTTAPPTTPPCKITCSATQYASPSCTCVACGAATTSAPNGTCNTGSATIVGGRCNGLGACVGTPVGFCLSTTKIACVNNPADADGLSAFCDTPADPALAAALASYKTAQGSTSTVTGVLQGSFVSTNPRCNLDIDCPIGTWCDGFYKNNAFNGQCQPNC